MRLIPAWAKDVKMGARMINARSETVHQKPAFRAAFKRRRPGSPCPSAGFGSGGSARERGIESFTIVTTAAYRRSQPSTTASQPAVIRAVDFKEWLPPDSSQDRLLALARRAHERPFDHWRGSRRVNNARNDDPDLLLPLEE